MPPRFSLIVSTRDVRSSTLNWHREQQSEETELILVPNEGRCGLGAAYNEGLHRSRGEFCCFLHDDVEVRSLGWLDRLAAAVLVDRFDLVGVAGTIRMPRTGGWWDAGRGFGRGTVCHRHSDGRLVRDEFGPPDDKFRAVSSVVSLDGVLLFGRRRDFETEPFDTELFDGFHFYDSDLSLRWLLWRGRRLAVLHGLDVCHSAGSTLDGWQPGLSRFHYRHGGFLPLTLSDVAVWSDNYSALGDADPGTAARLTAGRRPGSILSFAALPDGNVVGKAETGDVPLRDGDPNMPIEEPGAWFVLQGAGSGDVLDRLLRDDDRPVVVIEPEAHLVCWLLCRFHWAEEILSGRLRFLVPAIDQPAVAEVSLHEVVGALQQKIGDEGAPIWLAGGSRPWHADHHFAVRTAADGPTETRRRVDKWRHPPLANKVSVTVISPRCLIFDDLAACLSTLGVSTRRIEVPDDANEWTRTRYWHVLRQLREHPSDLVLARNRVFFEAIDPRLRLGVERFVPGRIVNWWWDDPSVSSLLDWRDPVNRRPGLGFAKELTAKLPPGSRWLPPAARMEFATAAIDGPGTDPKLPITFVGQSRIQLLRSNLNILANALAHYVGSVGHRLASTINRSIGLRGMHDALVAWRDELTASVQSVRRAFPAMGYYLDYLQRMAETAAFRLAAVETLANHPILVFGDEGWVESGAVSPRKYGGLLPPSQLLELYQKTRLNLNLSFMQVSSTVHPKVLDITACGGAVLTDARPELADLFPDAQSRPACFQSLDELPDLVSTLWAGDAATSRAACDHVRRHHTMRHRAEWIAREYGLLRRS